MGPGIAGGFTGWHNYLLYAASDEDGHAADFRIHDLGDYMGPGKRVPRDVVEFVATHASRKHPILIIRGGMLTLALQWVIKGGTGGTVTAFEAHEFEEVHGTWPDPAPGEPREDSVQAFLAKCQEKPAEPISKTFHCTPCGRTFTLMWTEDYLPRCPTPRCESAVTKSAPHAQGVPEVVP